MTKTYLDAQCPILNQKGRNIGYIWNFYGKIDCPTTVDFGSDTDELAYFRVKSAATSGDLEGVKGRVESEATTGTTMNINALHGDAVVNAGYFAVTVRGIYTDAMVKAGSTCTSVRGGDFNVSIYDGATITNCEGLRVVVGHPNAAVSISGVDTILHLVLDGSNNHVAKSAIDIDCKTGTTLTTGIDMGDSCVTGILMGDCTTGIAFIGDMANGIVFNGAFTDDVIDFTDVTINHTGSGGPCFIRAGAYESGVTNADEDQSGMIRLYGTTTANGTSYDRGVFVCLTTTGTKGIFPIAGLAEVRAQTGEGPVSVMAAQFICDLHTTDAKLAATTGVGGMFAIWAKITAIDGATCHATSKKAAIWLDNQMYGNNAAPGEEYTIYATTGGLKPDAFIGFETTSSGWSNLLYFDETAYDQDPISSLGAKNEVNSDGSIKINLNGTTYYIPYFAAANME